MSKKNEKLIVTCSDLEKDEIGTRMLNVDETIFGGIPFFTESAWIWPKSEKIVMEEKSHSHKFDEVVTLFGSDPDKPQDLCGEVEFWMEDEKFLIHESCNIYIPKGTMHCPLIFNRVERPIFHYIVGQGGKYSV